MSHEHFKGKFEVELKFRLASKAKFLAILSRMPYEIMVEENRESDWYFDTPDDELQSNHKSLCIRKMEPSGINLWIVKGPGPDRCEATNIVDPDKALSMLKTLGYGVVLQVEKVRSIYFLDKFHITVDRLNNIGDFAEFAIMTDDENQLAAYRLELEQLARKFDLSMADLELKSYKELCMEYMASTC